MPISSLLTEAKRTDGPCVRIGVLTPLSRPGWIDAGRHLLAGMELAVRDVNDTGGRSGAPLVRGGSLLSA